MKVTNMSKKSNNVANVEIVTNDAPAVFVSFAQYCRDNNLNAKSMRAKLRRYAVSKTHNNSRNYDYHALTMLNADLEQRRANATTRDDDARVDA